MSKSDTRNKQGDSNITTRLRSITIFPLLQSWSSSQNTTQYLPSSSHTDKTQIMSLSECVPLSHCVEWSWGKERGPNSAACLLLYVGYLY